MRSLKTNTAGKQAAAQRDRATAETKPIMLASEDRSAQIKLEAAAGALFSLVNEIRGWLGAYDGELRAAVGHTNMAVMYEKIGRAEAVLCIAPPKGAQP